MPTLCQLCGEGTETVLYVIRDCRAARRFWDSFPLPFPVAVFYGINLVEWLR